MEENDHKTNQVTVVGRIASGFTYDHEFYGEKFYSFYVAVKRDSGKQDLLLTIISERLINTKDDYTNRYIYICGQYRSYNQHEELKTRLLLYLFVLEAQLIDESKNVNDVFLEGYICKTPVYRETPLGRQITDVIIAVNRAYGKSDHIPCICWGRLASYVNTLQVGERIRVAGRIQSREYIKDNETKVAYELSVNLLEKVG